MFVSKNSLLIGELYMKFTDILWNKNEDIYKKIINMPFNKELMDGSLDKNIFSYYIEQDSIYLKNYAKALAIIASKTDDNEIIKKFADFSKGALFAEEEVFWYEIVHF